VTHVLGQWPNACKNLCSQKKHLVVQLIKFLHVSIDEAIVMDCHGWIVVHLYVVEGWKHIPILLNWNKCCWCYCSNLTKVIMGNLLQYGGLSKIDLVSKLINLGANGMLAFLGAKFGVII